jgi:hypothetical protein
MQMFSLEESFDTNLVIENEKKDRSEVCEEGGRG